MFFTNLTAISISLLIFQLSICSSLSINEIELNPADSDVGNEWLELYSEEKINLEHHYLENEDGDIYNLNGSIEGYLVINFEKQWLDNSKAIIYLKIDNKTITQTLELSDSKNNDLTLNLCKGSLILLSSSKGSLNNCNVENKSEKKEEFNLENKSISQDENQEKINSSKSNSIKINNANEIYKEKGITLENLPVEKIFLNEKEGNMTILSKDAKFRLYITYFFTILSIILIILISLRKL